MTLKRAVFAAKRSTALRSSDRMYRALKALERQRPEQRAQERVEMALAHARFAMANTVFYARRYAEAGFELRDLEDPANFGRLPIVEKAEVREHFAEFRSSEATGANTTISTSGGSTGEPLKVLRDLRTPTRAIEWQLFDWWGVSPADDIGAVVRPARSGRAVLWHDLQWWPSRRLELDAHRMDPASMGAFLDDWARVQPGLMIGYVGGLVELARFVVSSGRVVAPPTAIGSTAAPLAPAQRHEIEQAFGAPVYDHYRATEIPWLAGECAAQEGLHVFADVRGLEVVGDDDRVLPVGETGQVVATDLTNRVFPMVRYRLGDRTAYLPGDCSCGVTLPRIRPVAGRISDVLRLPSGRVITGGLSLAHGSSDGVRQFQIHQHVDRSITLRCVPGSAPDAHRQIGLVMAQLADLVDHEVPVTLELVDAIPHDGGKIRYTRSDVVDQPDP